MMVVGIIIGLAVGLAVGGVVAFRVGRRRGDDEAAREAQRAAEKATQIIEEADQKARTQLMEAQNAARQAEIKTLGREEKVKAKESVIREREAQIQKREDSLDRRGAELDRSLSELQKRERAASDREERATEREREVNGRLNEAEKVLEQRAGLSRDQARKEIVDSVVDQARLDAAKFVKRIEEEARDNADRKSKRVLSTAIMRYAGEYVSERTVSVVSLPNDDMKGRIIGREGRNIRAFEAATGIDLIIDDTPEAVILSGFDPVRREVARISLERLIADGRIHPTRIEEVIDKARKEVDQSIKEAGEYAVMTLDVGGMHPEVIKTLGRLKYRTSYGQNVLSHAMDVGFLTGIMMSELGLDTKLGRRAGLLHDLGKAVDHEVEGPHAVIGANLARKFGEKPAVVHAIAAHHEDEKPNSVLACLVTAADAMSGARPGARREMLESYIRRLEDLEAISREFRGVQKSFAIQAGRELRIMVESGEVSDESAVMLARDVAQRIEEKLTYPGQIKVTVIRETRAVEFAK